MVIRPTRNPIGGVTIILQREVLLQNRQRVRVQVPDLFQHDPVALRYERLFKPMGWEQIGEIDETLPRPGRLPHPQRAYVGAFIVMSEEKLTGGTELRGYLLDHPALVWLLGWRVAPSASSPFGFDVAQSVPTAAYLNAKLRWLDQRLLAQLLAHSLGQIRQVMPEVGQTAILDTKHLYARVKQNTPRAYVSERYNPEQRPRGDRDCRLGVKRRKNQGEAGSSETEYLWGYGSGVAASPTADGDAIVLADFTQPFNENDVTYALPLLQRATAHLGFAPPNVTGDAAFDAWYVYQWAADHGGLAAIALNARGQERVQLSADNRPLCHGLPMVQVQQWREGDHRQARFRCSLCRTIRKLNIEPGNLLRWRTDRQAEPYRIAYRQRGCIERINSQAEALGIDRPRQRCQAAISRRNTLIYIVINLRALQRYHERHGSSQCALNVA